VKPAGGVALTLDAQEPVFNQPKLQLSGLMLFTRAGGEPLLGFLNQGSHLQVDSVQP
jgi:hypothetical protein